METATQPCPTRPQGTFYGWHIAASCFFILAFTVGIPLYAMPFYYDYFIEAFGWSREAPPIPIVVVSNSNSLQQPRFALQGSGARLNRFRHRETTFPA